MPLIFINLKTVYSLPFFAEKGACRYVKVMLHGTISNDDFYRNTTRRCNVGTMLRPLETMLKQCCDAVLRYKSSLRIVSCNITFSHVGLKCTGEVSDVAKGVGGGSPTPTPSVVRLKLRWPPFEVAFRLQRF